MKKRYKLILFNIVIAMLINMSSTVLAKSSDENQYDQRIKELSLEARTMDVEVQVNAIINEGVSQEDAEYFVRLNNFVKMLEKENIEVLIDEEVDDISDDEFLSNKEYYRDKILHGDKRALKKALQSLNNLFRDSEYAEKVINTFSDKIAFKVIYPDGSKISFDTRGKDSAKVCEPWLHEKSNEMASLNGIKNEVYYNPIKLGYEETMMEEGVIYEDDEIYWREGEWAFESGISFSKVYLYTEFYINENGTSTISYARGGQSSYGIVNIANSTGGVVSRPVSLSDDIPAEARNEVVFTVSGSFGASFLIISLAAESGMNWTQYIIFRLYDGIEIDGEYESKYGWYAAEYK